LRRQRKYDKIDENAEQGTLTYILRFYFLFFLGGKECKTADKKI
jgi:hypothetical protein